jgi:hypothetical protein
MEGDDEVAGPRCNVCAGHDAGPRTAPARRATNPAGYGTALGPLRSVPAPGQQADSISLYAVGTLPLVFWMQG